MRYKTKRGFLAACPNRYSATIEPYGARTLFFIYYIVPAGCGERDALVRGNLMTATAVAAKQYVQGVTAPSVKGQERLRRGLAGCAGERNLPLSSQRQRLRPHPVVDAAGPRHTFGRNAKSGASNVFCVSHRS